MKFKDDPKTMVITTQRIINNETKTIFISHDEEDGMWQFLDGVDNDENNARIISLEEMVAIDETVQQIADLPIGYIAWRKDQDSEWYIEKNIPSE